MPTKLKSPITTKNHAGRRLAYTPATNPPRRNDPGGVFAASRYDAG